VGTAQKSNGMTTIEVKGGKRSENYGGLCSNDSVFNYDNKIRRKK